MPPPENPQFIAEENRRVLEETVAQMRNMETDDAVQEQGTPLEASAADFRWAAGVLLATPAHFGYMSGALKHCFDTVYEPLLDETRGLPYALVVKGRSDTDGAVAAVHKIVTGLAWKEVRPPLAVVGDLTDEHLAACTELGQTMAAGLALGIF